MIYMKKYKQWKNNPHKWSFSDKDSGKKWRQWCYEYKKDWEKPLDYYLLSDFKTCYLKIY